MNQKIEKQSSETQLIREVSLVFPITNGDNTVECQQCPGTQQLISETRTIVGVNMREQFDLPYRWVMLACLFFINLFFNGMLFTIIPSLLPNIANELNLDYEAIGSLWGSNFFGMMVFTLIGGAVADRIGVKKAVTGALFMAAIIAGLRGWAPGYRSLWVSFFLLGACVGFLVPILFKSVMSWFSPNELSRANGILLMGASVGMSIGIMTGAPLNAILGNWRNVMYASGIIGLFIAIVWIYVAREQQLLEYSNKKSNLIENFEAVFKIKDVWLLGLIELIVLGCIIAVLGFLPTYLVQSGISPSQAGLIASIPTWGTLIGLIIGPYFSDKIGVRKVFIWPSLIVSAIFIALIAVSRGWLLYVDLFVLGFASGCTLPLMRSIVGELDQLSSKLAGTAFGLLLLFNRIGGFIIPWFLGFVITTTGNLDLGFYALGVLMLTSPLLILGVKETGSQH